MQIAPMALDNGCSQHQLPASIEGQWNPLAIEADHELKTAARFASVSRSANTRRAYVSDFLGFSAWCAGRRLEPLPAASETVARYLSTLAEGGKKTSTIRRALAAITYAHRLRGLPTPSDDPSVKAVMAGIRRELGVRPTKKAPVTADVVKKLMKLIPGTVQGARDRALLLVGFAGAFRRSELVALRVEDLELQPEGLLLHIRRSKTDQEGVGRSIAIPRGGKLGTAEALQHWLHLASISSGPLFRSVNKAGKVSASGLSDGSVAAIVKRYARLAGLDPETFAGHSLRAGFVTSALDGGADALRVMDVTGHRDVRTLQGYDRRQKFARHAGRSFL